MLFTKAEANRKAKKVVNFRFTEADLELLDELCEAYNQNRTAVMTRLLKAEGPRYLKDAPTVKALRDYAEPAAKKPAAKKPAVKKPAAKVSAPPKKQPRRQKVPA